MADGSGVTGARYRAFISYSHRDSLFAARLHRRLEGYVLPKRLGAERRLTPIFKDREELPAAHDLSAQVRAALAASDCLIVVCSPDAAASPWVGREITLFRELHPERPILAALVRGEPAEGFPPALAAGGVEPLAADFRKVGDGDRLALLKLVAGIAGVGVDQLVQRDAQRRLRGVMAVTAIAIAATLTMGAMTLVAFNSRAEAQKERERAESLVEFMLTDLRTGLKGAGSLRVRGLVNQRALRYYDEQNTKNLPPSSLQRRIRILHAEGEDYIQRGEIYIASIQFDAALRASNILLQQQPQNDNFIFLHSQSLYWSGYAYYLDKKPEMARRRWSKYKMFAENLFQRQPDNSQYVREVAFAEGALCSLAVRLEKDAKEALTYCGKSLAAMKKAISMVPKQSAWELDLANCHGWMADAFEIGKDWKNAERSRRSQESILDFMLSSDPENMELLQNWTATQLALARISFRQGRAVESQDRLLAAEKTVSRMLETEPTDDVWRDLSERIDTSLKSTIIKQKGS